jgi:hypothetical protein
MKTQPTKAQARAQKLVADPANSMNFYCMDDMEYEFFHALHEMAPSEWSAKDSFHAYRTAQRLAHLKRISRIIVAAEKVAVNLLKVLQEDLKRLNLIVPMPTEDSPAAEAIIFQINPASQQ